MNQLFDTLPFPAHAGAAQREMGYELEQERGGRPYRGGAYRAGAYRAGGGRGGRGGAGAAGAFSGAGAAGGFGAAGLGGGAGWRPREHLRGNRWPRYPSYFPAYYGTSLWPYYDGAAPHSPYCDCSRCGGAAGFDVMPFGAADGRPDLPFSPDQEQELAMELLSVSSEAEMEQFLGNVFSSVWKGVKKVASPLGGVLKAVAKRALPYVGGALGSLIPIPGVGTALGRAVGTVVSQALEMEFGGLALQQQEFEMARRFVRLAGTAAQLAGEGDGSPRAVRAAVLVAARRHVPALARPGRSGGAMRRPGPARSLDTFQRPTTASLPTGVTGRWRRRGNRIVLSGDF